MIGADGPLPRGERDRILRPQSHEILLQRLLPDFLPLGPDYQGRDLPVILLLGPPGSDKTVLLTEIKERCAGLRPWVLRDLGPTVERPHEIAVSLAFGLSAKVKRFRPLSFPRLLLGLIAISGQINRRNRAAARADLQALLENRPAILALARQIIRRILPTLVPPGVLQEALGLALEGILAELQTIRILRGRALTWYREPRGTRVDPLDTLIDLNLREAEGTGDALTEVDEALCAAFLADLRDAFGRELRTANCLALLEHADSGSGQGFLKTLVTVRHRHRRFAGEDCDPLLVIATADSRLPALLFADEPCPPIRGPEEASYEDWQDHRGQRLVSWFYPIGPGGLDAPEDTRRLRVLARAWSAVTTGDELAAFTHRLTHGHLWSSLLVLRAFSAAVARHGPQQVDLRGVLDWPDPDDPDRALADGASARLLRNATETLRGDLVTCAAAGDMGGGSRLAALGRQTQELEMFCATNLWVRVNGPPMLHPFLRRVLLHALAQRKEKDQPDWALVHDRLRRYYRDERPDIALEAQHALALGELPLAVRRLADGFVSADKVEWLVRLYTIAAAPRRDETNPLSPCEQVDRLASAAAAEITESAPARPADVDGLADLIAALWVSIDPLGDPGRTLDSRIAHDLERLALPGVRDRDVLLAEAGRYRNREQRGRWPDAWPT